MLSIHTPSLSHTPFPSLSIRSIDLSWIIPNKFIAFSGPVAKKRKLGPGVYTLAPPEYISILKSLGVTCIVRFNSKCYDKTVFTSAGFRFVDLLYDDGANPPEAVLQV